jgi:hypothetical protein
LERVPQNLQSFIWSKWWSIPNSVSFALINDANSLWLNGLLAQVLFSYRFF